MMEILSYILFLGPYVAVAIFAAIFLVGFSPWAWKHPERWLFWVILLLSFGPATGDASGEGSLTRQITWGVLFMLVAAILLFRPKAGNIPQLKLVPIGLILLTGLLVMSVAWSPEPFISFKRVAQVIGVLLIGLLMARVVLLGHTMQTQMQKPVMFLIGIGLTVAVLVPSMAFDADGALRAISPHKNTWGGFSLLASLVFFVTWLVNRQNMWLFALVMIGSVVSLILSRSTTSLVSFILIAGSVCIWLLATRNGMLGKITLIAIFIVLVSASHGYFVFTGHSPIYVVTDWIYSLTGKDQTLTGRKYLWDLMFLEIAKHPWLGTGYGGFWTNTPGPSSILVSKLSWGPPVQAHSGFIDIINEIGILGILLLASVLFIHLLNIIKLLRTAEQHLGLFHGVLLFSVLINNYAETSLLRTTHIFWIIICMSIFEVHVLTHFYSQHLVSKKALESAEAMKKNGILNG